MLDDLDPKADAGDIVATAELLLPILYDDLRRAARRVRRGFGAGETLQTTALVHEAYLKVSASGRFADRDHFLRACALAMRHILVNNARDRRAQKRGSGAIHIALDDTIATDPADDDLLIDVNEALRRLAEVDLRAARVVECRFFAGFSEVETALALGITERTVRRDWTKARLLLLEALSASSAGPPDTGDE